MIILYILAFAVFIGVFKYLSKTDQRKPPSANLRVTETGSYVADTITRPASTITAGNRGDPESLFKSGRYNLAYERYLQQGNVFKAALSLLMLGPNNIERAVALIRERNPNSVSTAVDNLVKILYTKYSQSATAAALYRYIGEVDKAVAIEIATGINPVNVVSVDPVVSESPANIYQTGTSLPSTSAGPSTPLATSPVDDGAGICMLCDNKVEIGENFLTCRHCHRIGHYEEFYEWIDQIEACYSCQQPLDVLDYT